MSKSDDVADMVNDYLRALDEAGVDPRQFAAFVRNLTGSDDAVEAGDDNVPGFRYASRVSTAAFRAMAAHGEEVNRAWAEIRRGRYGIGTAMKTWAKLAELYYGVFAEAWRSPSQLPLPAWLVIPYSKENPKTHYTMAIDDFLEAGSVLDTTGFQTIGANGGTQRNVYLDPPKGLGSRIEFTLDDAEVRRLDVGSDNVGFIFRKGAGSAPPLAIIVIRVTA